VRDSDATRRAAAFASKWTNGTSRSAALEAPSSVEADDGLRQVLGEAQLIVGGMAQIAANAD
jgi:hypothetical protein